MPVAWSTRYWSCRRAGAAAASRRVLNDRSALRTAPGAHAPKSAASSWSGPLEGVRRGGVQVHRPDHAAVLLDGQGQAAGHALGRTGPGEQLPPVLVEGVDGGDVDGL